MHLAANQVPKGDIIFVSFSPDLVTSTDNISASNDYWINIYKTSKWGISTLIDTIMSFNFSFFQQGSYNYGNKKMWDTKIHVHKYIYICRCPWKFLEHSMIVNR